MRIQKAYDISVEGYPYEGKLWVTARINPALATEGVTAEAWLEKDGLHFYAAVAAPDGSTRVEVHVVGDPDKPTDVGVRAALELRRLAKERGVSY
jgi:hypothetical protein